MFPSVQGFLFWWCFGLALFLSLGHSTFIRTLVLFCGFVCSVWSPCLVSLSCKRFSFLFVLLLIFEQFEYQQAQLELEIENLSWKLERDELYCRGVSREKKIKGACKKALSDF